MAARYRKGRPARRKSRRKPRKKRRKPDKKSRAEIVKRRQKDAERAAFLKQARRFGYTLSQLKNPRKVEPLKEIPAIDYDNIEAKEVGTISTHGSLAEATNALNKLRDQKQQAFFRRSAFTSGLSVGLSIVAVLGVGLVLVYVLFRDKKKTDDSPQAPLQAPMPPIVIQNVPGWAVAQNRRPEPVHVPIDTEFNGYEDPLDYD